MNTTAIKKKIKELKCNTTSVSKELNELENIIWDSEEILFATSTFLNGNNWLLTCTDQRIILLDKGIFKGTTKEELEYKNIWNLETTKGIIFGTVTINTNLGGKRFKLEQLMKSDVDRLLDVIEQQKEKSIHKEGPVQEESLQEESLQEESVQEIKKSIEVKTPAKESKKNDIFLFNVAGVTKENDFGKDIQSILQKEGKKYCKYNDIDLYEGLTAKEIKEDGYETYEFSDLYLDETELIFIPEPTNKYDKNAIKIYIKYFENSLPIHVGYVPKDHTKELRRIIEKSSYLSIDGHYVGGKIKQTLYNPETDKYEIEVADLTIGIEITISYKMEDIN